MSTRQLESLPSSFSMYPKALFNSLKKKSSSSTLPDLIINLKNSLWFWSKRYLITHLLTYVSYAFTNGIND